MENFSDDLSTKFDFKKFMYFAPVIKRNIKLIIFIVLGTVITAVAESFLPLLNGLIIDNLKNQGNNVYHYIYYYLGIIVLISGGTYIFVRAVGTLEIKFSSDLRQQVFDKLQNMSLAFYHKNNDGWIIARVGSDVSRIGEIISWRLIDGIYFILLFVVSLGIIFTINVKVALVLVFGFPILIFVLLKIKNLILKAFREVRKRNSTITSLYTEMINGIATIKTLNLEHKNYEEFKVENKKLKKSYRHSIIFTGLLVPAVLIIGYSVFAVAINISGDEYLKGIITIGQFSAIMNYIVKLLTLAGDMSSILSDIQQAQANVERIVWLLEHEEVNVESDEVIAKYGDVFATRSQDWETIAGNIEFKHVDFGYDKDNLIFKNLNISFNAGESIALVGNTGGGKTTIVNLISRFYDPVAGEIYLDGKTISSYSRNCIASQLGYVLQFPFLFKGTVKENILYGSNNASEETYQQIVDKLGLKTVFSKLEFGDETQVGDGGGRLSVGEKQLVSFARALVRNPQIVILDEATSSIDTNSEELIQNAIETIIENRTSFIIAHRLSTIVKCDRILYIENGHICESGTHDELIAKKGRYFDLFQTQYLEVNVKN